MRERAEGLGGNQGLRLGTERAQLGGGMVQRGWDGGGSRGGVTSPFDTASNIAGVLLIILCLSF